MTGNHVNRRSVLRGGLFAATALAAPAVFTSAARAASKEVRLLGYAAFDYSEIISAFEAETGLKLNLIGLGDNDEMFTQAKLGMGSENAADLAEPASTNLPLWYGNELLQPMDASQLELSNIAAGMPGTKEGDTGYIDGNLLYMSTMWGGEGMGYADDVEGHGYGEASLGDIFDPQFEGQVTLRPHSSLAAMGRLLDAQGKLPFPYIESYTDEAKMKANWDIILAEAIKFKSNVAQFWTNDNEGVGAFKTNGCRVGLIWESIGRTLYNDGVRFVAPKEGAFGWNQGLVLLKGAPNPEGAHAFAKFLSRPDMAAKWAKAGAGLPSSAVGAELMDDETKTFTQLAYPEDAISKMWWWPPQDPWFIKLRGEYADKWRSA